MLVATCGARAKPCSRPRRFRESSGALTTGGAAARRENGRLTLTGRQADPVVLFLLAGVIPFGAAEDRHGPVALCDLGPGDDRAVQCVDGLLEVPDGIDHGDRSPSSLILHLTATPGLPLLAGWHNIRDAANAGPDSGGGTGNGRGDPHLRRVNGVGVNLEDEERHRLRVAVGERAAAHLEGGLRRIFGVPYPAPEDQPILVLRVQHEPPLRPAGRCAHESRSRGSGQRNGPWIPVGS